MNKAYIIWPVIGLLVFGVFFWNFNKGFKEKQRQEEVRIQNERKERARQEIERRKKAIEDANVAAAERTKARKVKEIKEDAEKKAHDDLVEKRVKVFDDVNRRIRPQLERVKSDKEALLKEIAQLELQKKAYTDEETFLRNFVRKAEGNVKAYYDVLDKLATAERLRAEAEAAAAKAKKS